ncbi:hypothetical protein BN1013_00126 [Candidatus Rubidus massiliensis]|nr:MAG: hypothetical protein BGO10_07580 [Chlamydia sp. 32-24]CDZ79630.1 hypothetical protein BN1013_00126 [Candidatus Rubidus massiliensis]
MNLFDTLPREILQNIFFSFGDNLQECVYELCNVEIVCQKWKDISSSNDHWKPLLEKFHARRYKLLCSETFTEKKAFKLAFRAIAIKQFESDTLHHLKIALEKLKDEELNRLFEGNTFQKFSIIQNDATVFLEQAIEKCFFEIALSFLLKDITFNHEKIFEKLLNIDANVTNGCFYYYIVLKHILYLKLDLSSVFNRLENPQLERLSSLMSEMCEAQNVSILRFVESGLDPNFLIASLSANNERMPLIYHFIEACLLEPKRCQNYYNKQLEHKNKLDQEYQKKLEERENYYGVKLLPLPMSQKDLLEEFRTFLKHKELDLNARNIRGHTMLAVVKHWKNQVGVDLDCLNLIEQYLLENGALK